MGAISSEARSGAISLPSKMRPPRRVDLMLSVIDAPGAMLRGRVVNEQGLRVPNVRAEVDGADSATVSGADGSFFFRYCHSDRECCRYARWDTHRLRRLLK